MIFLSNWQHEDEMCCMVIVYATSTRLEGQIYTYTAQRSYKSGDLRHHKHLYSPAHVPTLREGEFAARV